MNPLSSDSWAVCCPHNQNQTPAGFSSRKRFSMGFVSGGHWGLGSDFWGRKSSFNYFFFFSLSMAHILNRSQFCNGWAMCISAIFVFLFLSVIHNSLYSQKLKCLTLTDVWDQDHIRQTCRIWEVIYDKGMALNLVFWWVDIFIVLSSLSQNQNGTSQIRGLKILFSFWL